jgi:hypothetical protein
MLAFSPFLRLRNSLPLNTCEQSQSRFKWARRVLLADRVLCHQQKQAYEYVRKAANMRFSFSESDEDCEDIFEMILSVLCGTYVLCVCDCVMNCYNYSV